MFLIDLLLSAVTVVAWAGLVANIFSLHKSDAAGNGLAKVFAVFLAIGLWALLALLTLAAGISGEMPMWAGGCAVLLIPASGAAALGAIHVLSADPHQPRWPAAVVLVVPGLIVAFAVWSFVPAIRNLVPSRIAGGVAWGTVLVLSILPWSAVAKRSRARSTR
jgi:hypothetical protein